MIKLEVVYMYVKVVKRIMDFTFSLVAVIILSPIF